jgi:hypothetical protein
MKLVLAEREAPDVAMHASLYRAPHSGISRALRLLSLRLSAWDKRRSASSIG